MVSSVPLPRHLARLALFCACMMVLAWAASLLADALTDSHPAWPLSSSQTVTDPHDVHAHLGEMLDEPLIFTSFAVAMLPQLVSSFVAARPTIWAWSALPLFHPPCILNSI